ncbi:MAG: GntR family transcriptional regulator [Chloroflexi bacterium]|nr:GntR family transcriptional regulator [Chloroflexota bacterium]
MITPSLSTTSRTFLWQDAAAAVRRAIVAGDLRPGDRVSEAQLAGQLGVSRMPVRDAIRVLVQEGLLEQQHGATIVAAGSALDLHQLYDARLLLESHAIRLAAGRVPPAAEEELRRAIADMHAAAAAQDLTAFQAADLAVHQRLFGAAGHRWLRALWTTLAPTIAAAMAIADELAVEVRPMSAGAAWHEALLEEVLDGDAAAAIARLDRRLRDAPSELVARLRRPERGARGNRAPGRAVSAGERLQHGEEGLL